MRYAAFCLLLLVPLLVCRQANAFLRGGEVPTAALTYRTPISPRFLAPGGDDVSVLASAATWGQSRIAFTADADMNGFQVDAFGFHTVGFTGSEGSTYTRTVAGMLKYPSGTFYNFTWGGSASKVVDGTSVDNISDTLTLASKIPSGATYYINWQETGSAYILTASNRSYFSTDQYQQGTGTPPTLGASYANSGGASYMAARQWYRRG